MTLNPLEWFDYIDNWYDCLPEPRRTFAFLAFSMGWIIPHLIYSFLKYEPAGVFMMGWIGFMFVWATLRVIRTLKR